MHRNWVISRGFERSASGNCRGSPPTVPWRPPSSPHVLVALRCSVALCNLIPCTHRVSQTVNKACWRAAEEWIRPEADVQRRSDPYSWSLQPFSLHRFRLFSTSYQSAFQLSLVLLVCYRSCGSVFSLGRNSSPKFPVYYQTPVVVPNVIARETVRLSGLSPAKNRVGDAVFPDHTSTPHSRTRDARTSPHNTQARKRARFQVRLFSLRSPLLGESLSVSFPRAT